MAAACTSGTSTPNRLVSDEERRWVVIGVCLNKFLTPALRQVLSIEIPKWYQTLKTPPLEIHKQTLKKHVKNFTPSVLTLNYVSINGNVNRGKSPKSYDYAVKDPLSLAKLFLKPSMATFTGFDHTMDTSAVLSVVCETKSFILSGAAACARKVRSDVRNEWAHCDFSHWTNANFKNAFHEMITLVKRSGLTPVEEKLVLHDIDEWEKNGVDLCLGRPVDPQLLKSVVYEVADLEESFKKLNDDFECKKQVLGELDIIVVGFKKDMDKLADGQKKTELDIQGLVASQNDLELKYKSNSKAIEKIRSDLKLPFHDDKNLKYVFHAPDSFTWFTGRNSQIDQIATILQEETSRSTRRAAVCGLGGSGKTCLVAEYAHRKKESYPGGVFWLSGENKKKLENSVIDLALCFGALVSDSFDVTLSQTLNRISSIKKPWLMVLDDMDELRLSTTVRKVLCGSWQKSSDGHIIVTTRRKPSTLVSDISDFNEEFCLRLECFNAEDGKEFLFCRTGISRDQENEIVACRLVEELGGLPLALEQAGAYIKSLGCSLSSYLESYLTKRLMLLHQQETNPVSEYASPERLAVKTTWLLNLDYIKQNSEGRSATRFLNACSFFNSNEIQEELINIGQPRLKDTEFSRFVGTSLGRYQIFKLLTDFSLFKETAHQCLQVHRLVQEVVKENLDFSGKEESFMDAVRMLLFAFSKCFTPDALLSSVANKKENPMEVTKFSLFYLWTRLCLHAAEIREHLEKFLEDENGAERKLFFEETVRVVYQCAVYFSAFCKHEDAIQVLSLAYKIVDWIPFDGNGISVPEVKSLFSHDIPLPENIRRHIQYCCKSPFSTNPDDNSLSSSVSVDIQFLGELRADGNRLFSEGRFREAITVYSRAIRKAKESPSLDARFFSNRSSAYLKLGWYGKALKDADAYISWRPECWKGYARKALALHCLNDVLASRYFAVVTSALFPDICNRYEPFRIFSDLDQCFKFCATSADVLVAVEPDHYDISQIYSAPDVPRDRLPWKVILLTSESYEFKQNLMLFNCILLGCNKQSKSAKVHINLTESYSVVLMNKCAVGNINFSFNQGNYQIVSNATVFLYNCSFTSRNENVPAAQVEGTAKIHHCNFMNSGAGGLLCLNGSAVVENCTFSGNGLAGVEVRYDGSLDVRKARTFNNKLNGLRVGPKAKKCILRDSQVFGNKHEGILLWDENLDVTLINNTIFHNDEFGISVRNSFAVIEDNHVFENGWWGIWIQSNSCVDVFRNEVASNRLGGIRVGLRPRNWQPSIVNLNNIHDNGGPGLIESINDFDVNHFRGRQVFSVSSVSPLSQSPLPSEETLVHPKCLENVFERNGNETEPLTGATCSVQLTKHFCSGCQMNAKLQKCVKCYFAEYCSKACQKKHWKRHKQLCASLLKQSSVLLTSFEPFSNFNRKDKHGYTNFHHSSLEEVGPKYSDPPPKDGKRFIVKVQTCYDALSPNVYAYLLIYDRSLEINGRFESQRIFNLIRELGAICAKTYVEKKLFLWAAYADDETIRVFTNDFPPFQKW